MSILKEKTPLILKLYEVDSLEKIVEYPNEAKPMWIWGCVCDGTKDLNLAFEVKKQLFLELIEYYMEKGLLKFKGTYSLNIENWVNEKGEKGFQLTDTNNWDENISIKDTIVFFDKHFPTEDKAKIYNASFDSMLNLYFYGHLPAAYWFWKDPEDPNDKGQWYACD